VLWRAFRATRTMPACAASLLVGGLTQCAPTPDRSRPSGSTTSVSNTLPLPVRTDSALYHLHRIPGAYRAWVRATYVNQGDSPIYYHRCQGLDRSPIFWVRRAGTDSTRQSFSDMGWGCGGGVPLGVLARGDSLVVRAPLGTVDQPQMEPPLRPEWLVGQFRVVLELCAPPAADNPTRCIPLPDIERVSQPFEVRYHPGVAPPPM
jgi:hypothetical protein